MARKKTSTETAADAPEAPAGIEPMGEAPEETIVAADAPEAPTDSDPATVPAPEVPPVLDMAFEAAPEAAPEAPPTPNVPVTEVPAPVVAYYRVTATSRFVVGGQITELREGSVLSTLTHRIEDVRAQGVPLARCGAPHTTSAPYAPQGYMLAPAHDFEMQEEVDPLLALAMGSDR